MESSRLLLEVGEQALSCLVSFHREGLWDQQGIPLPPFDEMEGCNETHKHTCPRLASKPQLLNPQIPSLLHLLLWPPPWSDPVTHSQTVIRGTRRLGASIHVSWGSATFSMRYIHSLFNIKVNLALHGAFLYQKDRFWRSRNTLPLLYCHYMQGTPECTAIYSNFITTSSGVQVNFIRSRYCKLWSAVAIRSEEARRIQSIPRTDRSPLPFSCTVTYSSYTVGLLH
jgi:hypothetical protein